MTSPVMTALAMARANDRLVALGHDEAPRSWSRDAKMAFLNLPPALQAYYVDREKDREREVRKAQNDRADALKKLATAEARTAELEAELAAIQKSTEKTDGTTEENTAAAA